MTATEIEEFAKKIESLRGDMLFGDADLKLLGPMSEQHFLAAIAQLELAERYLKIAHYQRMRGD